MTIAFRCSLPSNDDWQDGVSNAVLPIGLNRVSMNGECEVAPREKSWCWRLSRLRTERWSGGVLCGYALALFVGTHIPRPDEILPIAGNDKWLHFCAYFGLAFLWATWRSCRTVVGWRTAAGVWFVMALIGAADELTQQLPGINRHCDLLDWIADISGSASGLLAWHLFCTLAESPQGR